MKSRGFLWIIIFLLLSDGILLAQTNKKVLIINSYHRGFQWSDDVISGIEQVLYNTNIDTNFLYMDSKRISSKKYYQKLQELYKLQLKKEKI